jgi:hypothetical protein
MLSFIKLYLSAENLHEAVQVFFNLQKYNFVLHLMHLTSFFPSVELFLTLFLILIVMRVLNLVSLLLILHFKPDFIKYCIMYLDLSKWEYFSCIQ